MLLKNIARIFRENLAILGWRIALIGIVSILLSQTLIILLPKIFQQIIATIDSHGPYQTLAYWCGIATIVSLVAIAAQLVRYRVGDYSWGVVYARRTVDYKQLLTRKNYATLLNYGTGKLISRMSKGIDAEGDIMYHLVFSFAENIFRIGSICIILIYYSAWLALGMLSLLVVVALLQVLIAKKLAPVAEACETTHEDEKRHMARIVMENLLIRVSNREHSEVARGQEIVRDYPRLNFLYAMYSWSLFHLLELGFRGIEIAMFFWFGWQSIQ
ncbi:MAG TPA: ABC transporter transmembrane domain-containing protein [bacterium]|nr:ABC transporter transmembrane domain-containing protein [bacterium]